MSNIPPSPRFCSKAYAVVSLRWLTPILKWDKIKGVRPVGQWRAPVNTVMNFGLHVKTVNYLACRGAVPSSRTPLVRGNTSHVTVTTTVHLRRQSTQVQKHHIMYNSDKAWCLTHCWYSQSKRIFSTSFQTTEFLSEIRVVPSLLQRSCDCTN
jgi:hypothetical protein